jgi:hypothetical protein
LEWVYNSIKENSERSITLDEIINHYIDIWKKDLTQDILIVKKQLTQTDYFNKGIQFLADYYQSITLQAEQLNVR